MTRVHSGGHRAHRSARSTGPARVRGGEAVAGWGFPSFSELWAYRDLVYFLARRDVAARYKQTAVGALWALLQPLGMSQVRGFVRSPSEWSVEQPEGQMRPVISSREHFA